jgi:hypothetical protein
MNGVGSEISAENLPDNLSDKILIYPDKRKESTPDPSPIFDESSTLEPHPKRYSRPNNNNNPI